MRFFVSRQVYWPDGQHTVEIATGGLDYANPDMLVAKYKKEGEGQEFINPTEAADAAILIAQAWKRDCPNKEIHVAAGSTGGFTCPFEPMLKTTLYEWAKKQSEKLPRCAQCGEIIDEKHMIERDDEVFCREYCAEKYWGDPDVVDEDGED